MKMLVSLILTYILSFSLIKIMMIPVGNFQGTIQDILEILFLDNTIFQKYALNKMDITLYFLFMINFLILFTIYNRNIIDAHNYHLLVIHRYSTIKKYIFNLFHQNISKMHIILLYDLLSIFVASLLLSIPLQIHEHFFLILIYVYIKHLYLAILSISLKAQSLYSESDQGFTKYITFTLVLLVIDIFTPLKIITLSITLKNHLYLLTTMVIYILIGIYVPLQLLHNKNH